MIQNCVIQQEIEEKKFVRIFFEKLQVLNAKTKAIFKKISLSEMIQNCLIRRERAKKFSFFSLPCFNNIQF